MGGVISRLPSLPRMILPLSLLVSCRSGNCLRVLGGWCCNLVHVRRLMLIGERHRHMFFQRHVCGGLPRPVENGISPLPVLFGIGIFPTYICERGKRENGGSEGRSPPEIFKSLGLRMNGFP
jgi:hypothetical protein